MNQMPNDIDFLKFLGIAERQHIEPLDAFREETNQILDHGGHVFGERLPWEKADDAVRLRPGEVSLWAGVNGHGKSLVLGQVLLWLESNCLIASLEMRPAATVARLIRQALGNTNPTEQFRELFYEATRNMWLYNQTDTVASERILGMCHYAAMELGIKHIAIDSLMKCGIGPDDYARQKEFVDRLCNCARTHNAHIHLVHHIRKSDREGKIPDKFDIKGAGEITDLVDNIFIVHRNKDKEQKHPSQREKMMPDEVLRVAKQRHGDWEGDIKLWFHPASTQFVAGPDAMSLRWRA